MRIFQHLDGRRRQRRGAPGFYDEYLVGDGSAGRFYLQTVEHVFQEPWLPKGDVSHRGEKVEPAAIRETRS